MKPIFTRISIYLNIILVYIVLLLSFKLGFLDGILSAMAPPLEPPPKLNATPSIQPPTDTLSSDPGWQNQVKNQVSAIQGQEYKSCLFGDSISEPLHNSFGQHTFNFALSGMSTVSLAAQLNILNAANLKCSQVIIAIGTNDAWYRISNNLFVKILENIIALSRKTGAKQIVLIPAFYATPAASHDVNLAGSNQRIDEINTLIGEVGKKEKVLVATKSLQELFNSHALKEKLTLDGVHLNEDGLTIYRLALLNILNPSCQLLNDK